jgi:type II secretory pathway component PulL
VILAIQSGWCLAARVSLDGVARHDRQALAYRLEEKLPLAAEEFVADFISDARGQTALGVAARVEQLRPWVEALERAGVAVASISPAALLAAAGLPAGTFLLGEPDAVLVSIIVKDDGGAVSAWALSPATPEDVKLQLDLLAVQGEEVGAISAAGVDATALLPSRDVPTIDGSMESLAARAAEKVLSGRATAAVELRRDTLGPGDRLRFVRPALNAALAAAAVLLLAVAVAFDVRGWRYQRAADGYEARLADEFSKAFPGRPVPADVRWFVQSEHRRIAGGGAGFGAANASLPAEARESAARTMTLVLGALPVDAKLALERMTFADTGFDLQGRVDDPKALDAVAGRVRQSGVAVDPAQVRRDDDGFWSFTLRGSRPPQSVAAK